ncbi:MAG: DUF4124 domain-containing protein [Accumulibacter sp.]|uniref:DUF4124 domain-containing protein n=1 Tax=Accumulibacter sp. TaxID=2053492 RepID=UPI002FC2DD34
MKRFLLTAASVLFALAAQAQIYQWQDENNRTVISDLPPSGKVRQQRKIETETPTANAPTGKTMADREMEFRKRQKDSREAAEKAEKEQRMDVQRKEDCEASRRALQVLESGERLALRDSKGERYFIDDAQRAQEIAKVREAVQVHCK